MGNHKNANDFLSHLTKENEQMVDGGGSSGGSIVPLEHTQPNAADPKEDIVDDGLRDVKSG